MKQFTSNGQGYWAGNIGLTEAGAPANFTMLPFSLEQAQQVIEEARFQGQWRSLLTSMHLSFLYEDLRGQNTSTDAFLDEQVQNQATWRKALKIKKKETQKAYDLMQWCDRLSLILCREELPEAERALEISIGPDGSRYDVRQLSTGIIKVEPWPFEVNCFTVAVEASYLSQLQFQSEAELADALRQAPITTKNWELTK